MCGITGIFQQYRKKHLQESIHALHYRGPDEHTVHNGQNLFLLFDRLSINGVDNGTQPFKGDNNEVMICNGEIYNHSALTSTWKLESATDSDCEIVFQKLKTDISSACDIFNSIDGEFALIYDSSDEVLVARDPIGIRPLYVGYHKDQVVGFSSEAKGILSVVEDGFVDKIVHFPPGHFWSSKSQTFTKFTYIELNTYSENNTPWYGMKSVNDEVKDDEIKIIHDLLYEAVKKRLMSERPVAFFLSGGLDSSIIAAIGAKIMYPERITVFSIGTSENSPDVAAAKIVAEHLNAIHHVYHFEPKDAFEQVENTIRHLESYDCTTVRASVPMFMLCKYISDHFDFKVMLSGEGADELFGGYLYLHNAPSHRQFHDETISLIKNVHQFDALRADRCTAGNGLELRVPFFDLKLVDFVTKIHPSLKMPFEAIVEGNKLKLEKLVLRLAFADYLPKEILLRQKNGMSDAVGYSWIDYVRENSRAKLEAMDEFYEDEFDIEVNTPLSVEEHLYRCLFHSMFKHVNVVAHDTIWRPKWTTVVDPSARQLNDIFTE